MDFDCVEHVLYVSVLRNGVTDLSLIYAINIEIYV